MKQSILLVLFSVLSAVLLVQNVTAQTPAPVCSSTVPTPAFMMPGVTCGNVDDPCHNQCCANQTKEIVQDLPLISDILKMFRWENPLKNLLTVKQQIFVSPCTNGSPSTPGDLTNSSCVCIKPTNTPLTTLVNLCGNIKDSGEQARCKNCLNGGVDKEVGVWTSVGCVRSNIGPFIQETLLGWGVGAAGGISMLCIIYAAFMMQTSGGNAEKIKKAQQLMTSCITGLMLIIFSIFILQLIGVKILRIPGFTQ